MKMRNRIFFLVLMISTITFSIGQSTIENYLAPAFPTNLISSSDGKNIAWVFNDKGNRNVFLATGNDFGSVSKLTNYLGDNGVEISSLTFSQDNNNLLYVRGNTVNGQGYAANPAQLNEDVSRIIYCLNLPSAKVRKIGNGYYPKLSPNNSTLAFINGGKIYQINLSDTISKPTQMFQTRGVLSNMRWSPDGSKLVFVSGRGDHDFIGLFDMNTQKVEYLDPGVEHDGYPVWSPDGNKIAFIRNPHKKDDLLFTPTRTAQPFSIKIYDLITKKSTEVFKASEGIGSNLVWDLPVTDNKLLWTIDDQIVFPYEKTGWLHLYALDINSKTIKDITPGEGEVETMSLSKDKKSVLYSSNIGDINRRHVWRSNAKTGMATQLAKGENIEWNIAEINNGIAMIHSSATQPAWPAIQIMGSTKNIATDMFPTNFPKGLSSPQQIEIKAADGIVAKAQLFMPSNYDNTKKYPAVIFLHGGSRRQMLLGFNYGQYYSNAYALNQYFANKGYLVMALNFRSGIGYGLEFREAENYGISGASEVLDLFAAGEYLKNRKDVAANKIGLWGGSYGGYLTAHGLSRRSDLFAVGSDIHGVHNWNDELPTFIPFYDPLKFPDVAKKAFESSPMNFIDGWKSPVLLSHGDDDRNVPFAESVNLVEQLRKRNVYYEQLIVPDEVHSFLLHSTWLNIYNATFNFIDKFIGEKAVGK
jgi:dipeptidyl aminopeptidase/acylaminoacyl peptidase